MTARIYGAHVLGRRAVVVKVVSRAMSAAPNLESQIDFLKGEKHRKHPGLINMKILRLPMELQMAALSIINRSQVDQLNNRAQTFANFLWSRKRMVEDGALRKKAVSLEKQYWEAELETRAGETDIDVQALGDRIRRKVISDLKKTTYHWQTMKYDADSAVVYLASRLAGGYAAVRRALNEIKKRDPSFAPHSLLDFGSGLGTVVWASHACWGDTLKEMVCVDSSGPMNILAERLLKGDDEGAQPHIKQVYFRQFLPVSPKVQFDLVVAAFTLSELPTRKEREEAVFTLWRKTSSYLVLVENGTKDGHQILMEARDLLLTKQEKIVHDARPASVFAPCPHELVCPKMAEDFKVPCNFPQMIHSLPLPGSKGHQMEKFSYVILARTGSAEKQTDGLDWARLIAPVLRRTRHVHCHMCSTDGQMHHMVVTARKHGRDVYRCARNSEWGDQVPVIQKLDDNEDVQSDSEEEREADPNHLNL